MREKLSHKDLFQIILAGMSGSARSRVALATAEKILSRQVDTVLATTAVVMASNVAILAVLFFTLKDRADPSVLAGWAGLVVSVLVALAVIDRRYRDEGSRDVVRSRFWARTIEVVSAIRALIWGVGILLFFPGADPSVQLVLGPTAASIMFGGATVLNAIPSAAIAFVAILGGLTFSALVSDGSAPAAALAALTVAFVLYLLAAIVNQARFFISHALAEIENSEQKQTIGLLLKEFEDNSSDWLWHTDPDGFFVRPSARFAAATGRSIEMLQQTRFRDLFAPDADGIGSGAQQRFQQRKSLSGEDVALAVGQNRHILSLTAGPLFDTDGTFFGYRGVASDVTDLRLAADQLRDLAHFDQLTGLVNRTSFVAELNRAIAENGARSVGIVLLDLTGFKQVNDTLGHGVGDLLLAALGERLRSLESPGRQFARIGGDEFALLVRAYPSADMLAQAATETLALFGEPFVIAPHNVIIDASAGLAVGGQDGADAVALMRAADLALYVAKSSCRGCWRAYDADMAKAYLRRQNLERGLREAIEKNELHLRYQPIVSTRSGVVSAVEALLRWDSAEFGSVGPDEFVPIAEESGLIVPIGDWVVRAASRASMQLPDDVQICINVSPVQLRNRAFVETVTRCLAETGLAPERLVIEITEGVFLERSAQTDAVLGDFVAMGVQIALDDFGTGYSSLSYLRSFPFSKIKIDKSFIDDAAEGGPNASIVKASVDLAKAFGFEVVVEGVETHAQFKELLRLGCDYFQGYLFSKPLHETDLPAYLDAMAADPDKILSVDAA